MTSNFKEGSGLIGKWITNKNTLEYLGIWEKINNKDFNYPEFGVIEQEAGTNRFIMSAGQWIKRTNAIGIIVKAGRYGGTYAHKDIAFHFANLENLNAVFINNGLPQSERLLKLNQIAISQMKILLAGTSNALLSNKNEDKNE